MSRTMWIRSAAVLAVAVVLILAMTTFQVRQNENVILTRFGKPVRVLVEPGLHGKWPWPIESVNRFDARLDFFEARLAEALTKDKRNVIVPVFVAWRIADPLRFLESVGSVPNARAKIDSLVTSAKNTALAAFDYGQLVSTNRDNVKLGEIEQQIVALVAPQARDSFGVAIAQVGIKRVALPEANTESVLKRMQAERSQFAAKYRAEGRQAADEIRARTDAERTVMLAKAQKFAEETRGKSEADAARIYAEAHAEDPEFYRFLRELEALRKVVDANTTLVLDGDAAPFRHLRGADGKGDDE
ncbi:MAG: protease modulator HflC [Planctomycetota bacterium]